MKIYCKPCAKARLALIDRVSLTDDSFGVGCPDGHNLFIVYPDDASESKRLSRLLAAPNPPKKMRLEK